MWSHLGSSLQQLLSELEEALLCRPGQHRCGVVAVHQHIGTHRPGLQQAPAGNQYVCSL